MSRIEWENPKINATWAEPAEQEPPMVKEAIYQNYRVQHIEDVELQTILFFVTVMDQLSDHATRARVIEYITRRYGGGR